jgi:hypothetical protein
MAQSGLRVIAGVHRSLIPSRCHAGSTLGQDFNTIIAAKLSERICISWLNLASNAALPRLWRPMLLDIRA